MNNLEKPTPEQLAFGGSDYGVLKRFMKEFFPYTTFRKVGFFSKEMKGNYYMQAERVCVWFGYETVFQYGSEEIRCHLSEVKPEGEFITVVKNIYED